MILELIEVILDIKLLSKWDLILANSHIQRQNCRYS